jgi:hypothetical protein
MATHQSTLFHPTVIYGLTEPGQPWNVRYVGKVRMHDGETLEQAMGRRLGHQWLEARTPSNTRAARRPCIQWLRGLQDKPGYLLLDIGDSDTWSHLERWHIAAHRTAGFALLNANGGGQSGRRWPVPTHCVNGHLFTPETTYINPQGYRKCRQCTRDRDRRMRERRAADEGRVIGLPAAQRTHCPQGHEYTPENTWVNGKGRRICRTCNYAKWKQWYATRRAKK